MTTGLRTRSLGRIARGNNTGLCGVDHTLTRAKSLKPVDGRSRSSSGSLAPAQQAANSMLGAMRQALEFIEIANLCAQ